MTPDNDNDSPQKTCTNCGETKPTSEFYAAKRGRFGVRADCKDCVKERTKTWVESNPDKRRAYGAQYREKHKDELAEYLADWHTNNPDKSKEYSKRRYKNHKDEVNAATRAWQLANPEKHKASQAKWYANNKETVDANNRKWKEANPEKMREYANRHAKKRSMNPKDRLEAAIKSGVRRGITKGSKGGRRTFAILGYTADDLRKHLEKLFAPGMTWENYGSWHVDHKVPLSVFNYETPDDIDFKRCWALSNLQPLWERDNLSKKDKLFEQFQPSLAITA